MREPRNLLAEWAWLLIDSLVAAGIRDAVVSPGSRSTPFVLAMAAHPSLRIHDVIDERTAGFFALGMARATGLPPLLLCTSGTAGAHYLPSIIEAGEAHLPLLVLTADRPFELQACAAPQTIDQTKLFGDRVRAFFELGLPDSEPGALRALRRVAAQAVATAHSPLPGAVHLNARARKPLEPPRAEDERDEERALRARVRAVAELPPTRAFAPRLAPDEEGISLLARAVRSARRGLIVCGPAPADRAGDRERIFALAERTGFPILVEAASQLRFARAPESVLRVDAFDAILAVKDAGAVEPPDLVIQIGAPPTSGAWERYLAAHPDIARWVIAPHGWNDPQSDARGLLVADVGPAIAALSASLDGEVASDSPSLRDPAWRSRWAAANAIAWREIDAALDAGSALPEGEVARSTVRSLPPGALFVVGNSLPIRAVDSYAPASLADCVVLSQRGANGIDGLVSGAAGAAAISGKPTTLLLGDVSLLHDLGGLALAARLATPLVIVVVNNDGGRIFEQLPVASLASEGLLAHWTTPHGLGFEHAARQFGIPYRLVEDRASLIEALAAAQGTAGCSLVEARVPSGSAKETLSLIRASLEAQLGREAVR